MNPLTILKDIGKGIAWPFVHGAQLLSILNTALRDEPAVKTAVTGLIAQIGMLTAEGSVVISGQGLNITADMAELVAAKALWSYVVNTFLPAVDAAWKDVASEVQALESAGDDAAKAAAPAPAPASAVDVPQPGPGLDKVVNP